MSHKHARLVCRIIITVCHRYTHIYNTILKNKTDHSTCTVYLARRANKLPLRYLVRHDTNLCSS